MAAPSPDIESVSQIRLPPRRVIVAAGVLAAIVIGAAGADWLAPYPFDEMHLADRLHGPSFIYLAGDLLYAAFNPQIRYGRAVA